MATTNEITTKNEMKSNILFDKILPNRTLMAFIGLIIMMAGLSFISPHFLTKSNILNVLRQVSVVSIVSIGMTIVIIGGGIDLSVGSIMALSSLVTGLLIMRTNVNLVVSIFLGLLSGSIIGLLNGLMITTRIRMAPFIATLAMLSVARGVTLVITGGMPIYGLPDNFGIIGGGYFLGIPIPVIINVIMYGIGIYFLKYTRTGLYFFAVGGNEDAARLSGISVGKIRTLGYIISGLLAAFGGIILASRITSVEPIVGEGYQLDCIAAAVIGGTSMSGGKGSLVGTFIGALIMGFLRNGLNILNVSVFWQQVVIGMVIASTVALSTLRKR
ncbi:MAG: ABC transporter permease [Promethearchaeota archaeon]